MFSRRTVQLTSAALLATLSLPLLGALTKGRANQDSSARIADEPTHVTLVVEQNSATSKDLGIQRVNFDSQSNPLDQLSTVSVRRGEELYKSIGCAVCHSIDGSDGMGPTWKGIWGRTGKLTDGSSYTADAAYLRRSIENPTAEVVEGYEPMMPPYKDVLTGNDIEALIAYMKTR